MPILIKAEPDVEKMRRSGALVADVHTAIERAIKPGVKTIELDAIAREILSTAGATPSFLGYHGFPAAICVSVNDEIVHGIPGDRVLDEGDIVSVDVGAYLDGFHGDAAATYAVGEVTAEVMALIQATERAFWAGFQTAIVGNRVGDISAAIQASAEHDGFGIVRFYGGHGIGRKMHEDPSVLNYGEPGQGAKLQPGMTLAIEPMLTLGSPDTKVLDDDWTVVTKDGLPSAHYEHTVLITSDGPEALTVRQ